MSEFDNIEDLAAAAFAYGDRLDAIKESARSSEFGWYPYYTFGLFTVLVSMLGEGRRDLRSLAGSDSALDIGCGDGDLSFFLESAGWNVTSIENPLTNFNRTQGFQTLHRLLNSRVELRFADLDAGLHLASRTFGLACCFGLLYHLKNPFGFLETLARHSRYCLLSTRIAGRTPKGINIAQEPLAYLVAPTETNNDPTNYWIFSLSGLRRLIDRCGWDVCDLTTTGDRANSEPARPDRDERAYCLLRSKLADSWLGVDLVSGWHDMEKSSWRWTQRQFAVRAPARVGQPSRLRFRFTLHHAPARLHAVVDGIRLPEVEYRTAGEHVYEQPLAAASRTAAAITFEVDSAVASSDPRELGLQVVFWSYDQRIPCELRPIVIE